MNDISPAAAAQVAVSGTDLKCSACGNSFPRLWSTMNDDDTHRLRCGPCFDDRMFRDHPEQRLAAEQRRDLIHTAVLAAFAGLFATDDGSAVVPKSDALA